MTFFDVWSDHGSHHHGFFEAETVLDAIALATGETYKDLRDAEKDGVTASSLSSVVHQLSALSLENLNTDEIADDMARKGETWLTAEYDANNFFVRLTPGKDPETGSVLDLGKVPTSSELFEAAEALIDREALFGLQAQAHSDIEARART